MTDTPYCGFCGRIPKTGDGCYHAAQEHCKARILRWRSHREQAHPVVRQYCNDCHTYHDLKFEPHYYWEG